MRTSFFKGTQTSGTSEFYSQLFTFRLSVFIAFQNKEIWYYIVFDSVANFVRIKIFCFKIKRLQKAWILHLHALQNKNWWRSGNGQSRCLYMKFHSNTPARKSYRCFYDCYYNTGFNISEQPLYLLISPQWLPFIPLVVFIFRTMKQWWQSKWVARGTIKRIFLGTSKHQMLTIMLKNIFYLVFLIFCFHIKKINDEKIFPILTLLTILAIS